MGIHLDGGVLSTNCVSKLMRVVEAPSTVGADNMKLWLDGTGAPMACCQFTRFSSEILGSGLTASTRPVSLCDKVGPPWFVPS
jgi:hypothetical protein